MVFSDTTTKAGLIQECEIALFGDNGYGKISGDANRLLQFTNRINRRRERYFLLAFTADGTWQADDSNNTDFPIATTPIVSGQRDYTFDSSMLEIEKVMILPSATATAYITIYPVDIRDRMYSEIALNNPTNVGPAYSYDKTGNSLILGLTPNYSVAAGIKVIFKRPPNYYLSTDTTKTSGIPSVFDPYLARGAALDYAIDRTMPVANNLAGQVKSIESDIVKTLNRRMADERPVMTMEPVRFM